MYIIEKVLIMALILYSSHTYKNSAKLPDFIPVIINFYVASFGHIIHSPALHHVAHKLILMLFYGDTGNLITDIILIILISIVSFSYGWLFFMVISRGLMFRPNSMMNVTVVPHNYFFLITILIQMLLGWAAPLSKWGALVINVIVALIYIAMIKVAYMHGGFVYSQHKVLFLAASMMGALSSAVVALYLGMGWSCNLYEIWIFIAGVVIFIAISCFIAHRNTLSYLNDLDLIEDTNDLDHIKSYNHLLNAALIGYRHAHGVCISYDIFKKGINKYPN